jgi:hypothetical protein
MMKLFLLTVLATAALAQTPVLLKLPEEASSLLPETRKQMILAEEKIDEAGKSCAAWQRTEPRPGYYSWRFDQLREKYLAVRKAANEEIRNTISLSRSFCRPTRHIVSEWEKRARKQLKCR